MGSRFSAVAALLLCIAASNSAEAACPISNGDFASSTTGWLGGLLTFDNAVGNPVGSAHVGPVNANTCQGISECIPFTAGESCSLSAQVFFPAGQPADGIAQVHYIFSSDTTCTSAIAFSTIMTAPSSVQNTWEQFTTPPALAPPGTQSTQVILDVCAGPTNGLSANWDNVASTAPSVVTVPTLSGAGLALLILGLAAGALVAFRATHK